MQDILESQHSDSSSLSLSLSSSENSKELEHEPSRSLLMKHIHNAAKEAQASASSASTSILSGSELSEEFEKENKMNEINESSNIESKLKEELLLLSQNSENSHSNSLDKTTQMKDNNEFDLSSTDEWNETKWNEMK